MYCMFQVWALTLFKLLKEGGFTHWFEVLDLWETLSVIYIFEVKVDLNIYYMILKLMK